MSQALTLTGEVEKFAIVEPIHERNSFVAIIRKLRRSVAGFLPLPMIKLGIMQPSLEKLRKFFRLEHENKYQNTAVIGGLASMLDYWEGEARADSITEEVIQAVVARLRSYEKLSPEGRAESLKGLWKRIGEPYPGANQKPKEQTESAQVDRVQRQERRDVVAKGEPKQQNQNPVKQHQTPAEH